VRNVKITPRNFADQPHGTRAMQSMGRYQIQQELGRGAMAVVYQAYDPELKRNIALKVLHAERCANADVRRRFLREARAAGKLAHGNIVTIYDVGEEGDRPFIAMELLDGRFLDDLLKSGERFTWQQVLEIAKQLTRALAVAHAAGVIHRDIKPANIVWLPRQQQAKITDFGIARVDDATQSEATQAGHVIGTPQYMSPEQITGRAIDARSDLFSLGVVLYQLLAGQRPFSGENFATLTYQIAHQKPAPLAERVKDVPPMLAALVERLLEKSPERRYAGARELLDALDQVREGASVAAEVARRSPWLRFAPALAAVIALVIVVVWTRQTGKEEAPPPTATAPAPPVVDMQLTALLAQFSCAHLQAQVTAERALSVRGPMREEDLPRLMDALEQLRRFDNIAYEVDAMAWPFCEIAAILARSGGAGAASLHLETAPQFAAGAALHYEVAKPSDAGYLYADLYRGDGSVVHLPTGSDAWRVQPPFGDAMLVVMATRAPLRADKTSAGPDYLAALHRELQGDAMLVAAEYRMVTLEP
jgi:tRNA A-37 threonylcarbamoyl transferase component Bud32